MVYKIANSHFSFSEVGFEETSSCWRPDQSRTNRISSAKREEEEEDSSSVQPFPFPHTKNNNLHILILRYADNGYIHVVHIFMYNNNRVSWMQRRTAADCLLLLLLLLEDQVDSAAAAAAAGCERIRRRIFIQPFPNFPLGALLLLNEEWARCWAHRHEEGEGRHT